MSAWRAHGPAIGMSPSWGGDWTGWNARGAETDAQCEREARIRDGLSNRPQSFQSIWHVEDLGTSGQQSFEVDTWIPHDVLRAKLGSICPMYRRRHPKQKVVLDAGRELSTSAGTSPPSSTDTKGSDDKYEGTGMSDVRRARSDVEIETVVPRALDRQGGTSSINSRMTNGAAKRNHVCSSKIPRACKYMGRCRNIANCDYCHDAEAHGIRGKVRQDSWGVSSEVKNTVAGETSGASPAPTSTSILAGHVCTSRIKRACKWMEKCKDMANCSYCHDVAAHGPATTAGVPQSADSDRFCPPCSARTAEQVGPIPPSHVCTSRKPILCKWGTKCRDMANCDYCHDIPGHSKRKLARTWKSELNSKKEASADTGAERSSGAAAATAKKTAVSKAVGYDNSRPGAIPTLGDYMGRFFKADLVEDAEDGEGEENFGRPARNGHRANQNESLQELDVDVKDGEEDDEEEEEELLESEEDEYEEYDDEEEGGEEEKDEQEGVKDVYQPSSSDENKADDDEVRDVVIEDWEELSEVLEGPTSSSREVEAGRWRSAVGRSQARQEAGGEKRRVSFQLEGEGDGVNDGEVGSDS